jgi:hypothetical protein
MKTDTPLDRGFRAGTQDAGNGNDRTDSRLDSGRIGKRNLAAGWYSFAEALSMVADYLVAQGRDKAILKGLRASGMTVREYLHAEFDIVTGPRDTWHSPHISPERADMRSFRFALDTARWLARRRAAEERQQRKWRTVQAWRTEMPAPVM